MTYTPDPAAVAVIYTIDPDTHSGPIEEMRHLDGQPLSAAEAELVRTSKLGDWRAALEMHRLDLEIERERLAQVKKVGRIVGRYATSSSDTIADLWPLMTPKEQAEIREWVDR